MDGHFAHHLGTASQTPAKTKKPAAPSLDSLAEREESRADTVQSIAAVMSSPIQKLPRTPSDATIIKPPKSEMHPAQYHNGTMPAPSSALRLGFTDIKAKASSIPGVGAQQSTPSKSNIPSSPFAFSLVRNNAAAADSTLGPEALRIMNELRDQAAKIKAELVAQRDEGHQEDEPLSTRKIAKPKGKAGRYSDVHMSQFRKMDSIENHPSAFRAAQGRATPAASSSNVKSLKRTQSKANLDDTQTPRFPHTAQASSTKSFKKIHTPSKDTDSPAKRVRKHLDDDASTNRPVSHDGSNIPRPKTPGKDSRGIPRPKTLANLMSPTQASLARAAAAKTPTTAARSLLRSPSKINLTGLKKSATAFNLESEDVKMEDAPPAAKMRSTSLSDRVKSIFAKHKPATFTSKQSIPRPVAPTSKTPGPVRSQIELPPAPLTTPGKRFAPQRGDFTPAPKHAALAQNSPSPVKTGIPRSKAASNLVNYPSLDAVLEGPAGDTVSYPDLSNICPLPKLPTDMEASSHSNESPREPVLPPAVPGTFTFRSDHTIRFDSESPNGVGGHLGQASVRQVRPSMPPPMSSTSSSFPFAPTPNTVGPHGKENVPPYIQQPKSNSSFDPKTFAHGVSSKKRHRVEDDEEEAEREAAERAAKKARSKTVPEGEALVAPRLASARKPYGMRTPSKMMKRSPLKSGTPSAAASPSVSRKPAGISRDRLAYLAQPKQRK